MIDAPFSKLSRAGLRSMNRTQGSLEEYILSNRGTQANAGFLECVAHIALIPSVEVVTPVAEVPPGISSLTPEHLSIHVRGCIVAKSETESLRNLFCLRGKGSEFLAALTVHR